MNAEEHKDAFARLVRELDRGRAGLSIFGRVPPETMLGAVGAFVICLGLALIGLGWSGIAHSRFLQQELAYLVSGGLLGLALVVAGGFLYVGHLVVRQQR